MSRQIHLTEEKWCWTTLSLEKFIEEGNMPELWRDFFRRSDIREELEKISSALSEEHKTIYPSIDRVFRAFLIPVEAIKVVVLGQDPYHDGSATGLCFSSESGKRIPPSLRNIYTELEKEGYNPPRTGSLMHWATQGCFMLNTALTVNKDCPESHVHIWREFSGKLLRYISEKTEGVAWLLMGKKAMDFSDYVDLKRGHKIFCTSHPSPFSANRGFRSYPAFIGSGMFQEINNFLGKRKIEW